MKTKKSKTRTTMEEAFKGLSENLSGSRGRFQEGNDEQCSVCATGRLRKCEVGGGGKGLHLCCILTYNLDREVVGKEL